MGWTVLVSTPGRLQTSLSSPKRFDGLWGTPSLVYSGYQGSSALVGQPGATGWPRTFVLCRCRYVFIARTPNNFSLNLHVSWRDATHVMCTALCSSMASMSSRNKYFLMASWERSWPYSRKAACLHDSVLDTCFRMITAVSWLRPSCHRGFC